MHVPPYLSRFGRPLRSGLALLAALVAAGTVAAPAGAVISATSTIDGPTPDIVDLGNVAMAEDGTGGVVYRKRVDGKAHVFAARLLGGVWSKPQRLDIGQIYESSWPVIAAGNGGRLVVVWTHPFATGIDRLYFSALDPGASRFQRPQVLDPNVGVAAYTYPALAMNRGGQALLAYRVVTNDQPSAALPVGYVDGEIRLARYNGSLFSLSGAVVDRDPAQPQRAPDSLNGPKVGIALDGSGVVAWQEPDDDFYDRIWLRRVFSGSTSIVQIASPATDGDAPLRSDADAFSLAMTEFGAVALAVRQQPPGEQQGSFTRPRIYLNRIPEQFDDKAFAFTGTQAIDGAGADGPEGGPLGVPSVGVSGDGTYAAAYGLGGKSLLVEGNVSPAAPVMLGEAEYAVGGDPLVSRARSGALVAAWRLEVDGAGGVGVLARGSDGTPLRRLLSAETGGGVSVLRLGASSFGDAAVAFLQGEGSGTTINGALVDAPPGAFAVSTPPTWTRAPSVELQWDASPSGVTGVQYAVLVDDEEVASGLTTVRYPLSTEKTGDGAHAIKVIAEDGAGQETDSTTADLLIDRTAPRVTVAVNRARREVRVRVRDGAKNETAGLASGATVVSWGEAEGESPKARQAQSRGTAAVSRRYRTRGTFVIRVRVADEAGNRRTIRRKVKL